MIPLSDHDPVTYLSLLFFLPDPDEEGDSRAAPLTPLMPLPSYAVIEKGEIRKKSGTLKRRI